MVDGSVDEVRFRAIIGDTLKSSRKVHPRAKAASPRSESWSRCCGREGKSDAALKVEQLWNDLAKSYSFSLLCAYPMAGFGNEKHIEPFLKMCDQHSGVIPSESYLGLSQ